MAEMTHEVAEAVIQKAMVRLGAKASGPEPRMGEKFFGDLMFEAVRISFPLHEFVRDGVLEISFKKTVGDRTGAGRLTLDRLFGTLNGFDPDGV